MSNWLLYGAYGYTGRLLAAEALARGHQPVLGGRDGKKLAALGRDLGLPWQAFDLADPAQTAAHVADFDLVFHAAGPFVHTAVPMIEACLAGRTHYLDITGELGVLEATLGYDAHAREQGVVLISGAGFDIIPTDCLGAYVAAQLPSAVRLEIAIKALTNVSAGTVNSMIEMLAALPGGQTSMVRRDGRLVPQALASGAAQVTFSDGRQERVYPIPWGDLATAETTTGIPNVTAYMALPLPGRAAGLSSWAGKLLRFGPLRSFAKALVSRTVSGPDEQTRQTARAYLWARASDNAGRQVEAWLETPEAYRFTAEAGVRAVEVVLAQQPAGALPPALVLGPDFVLQVPDTRRYDTLPASG